jgi:plasmid stabilization system protein ParE
MSWSARTKRLAEFPGIGHLKQEANDDTLRFWSIYSYVIVYRENTNPLEILRVIHGARDIGSAVRRIR